MQHDSLTGVALLHLGVSRSSCTQDAAAKVTVTARADHQLECELVGPRLQALDELLQARAGEQALHSNETDRHMDKPSVSFVVSDSLGAHASGWHVDSSSLLHMQHHLRRRKRPMATVTKTGERHLRVAKRR